VEEKPTGNPWVSHRVNGIELAQSRPNPVLSGTELAFELENPAQASLRIYDLSGKLVRTLVTGSLPAGSHTARWDTRDESGKPVASGVYFYRLESSGLLATKQLVVTR
jgi:flagellar hook assembly protein FlgD